MLEKINQIFGDIKDAIVEKGVEVDDCASPDTYADRIMEIETCSNETCDGGSEGGSTSSPKASYFFLPAYKRSSTKPDKPSWTTPFTVNGNGEVNALDIELPNGWSDIDDCIRAQANSQEMLPLWVSYCAVKIYNSVVSSDVYYGASKWTEPICLGYPYANTSGSWVGDGGTSIVNNGGTSKTFVIFTNVSSSNITVYRPSGGTWNTSTNSLTGNITSSTSDGNTVYWYTSKSSASGYYTWVSIGTFGPDGKILGIWSYPFCINARDGKDGANGQNGQNGRDGVDGTNIEFIYKRCADMEAFRALTAPESDHYTNKQIPSGWTANPSGIDCDSYKIEAECSRTLESNGLWSDWSAPAIRSICGDGAGDGKDGRSITSVDYWFKVSASGSGITAPPLDVVDPTTEGWSKQAGAVSAQYPYLWCFTQTNFTTNLTTGFPYSRSDAYVVRRFNTDVSGEFSQLEALIESTRQNLQDQIDKFDIDFPDLDEHLDDIRTEIEGDLTDRLDGVDERLSSEKGSDVKLWEKLTYYKSDPNATVAQKSFSDIVLDAEHAKATLQTGSSFFDKTVGAGLTLDGLDGRISLSATKQELSKEVQDLNDRIDAEVVGASFDVSPGLISSMASIGQTFWYKDGAYYPYDHHLSEFINAHSSEYESDSSTVLSDYDTYMKKAPSAGGPSDGPFTRTTVVSRFSSIEEDADSIKSTVSKFNRMWKKGGEYRDYDYFKDNYSGTDSNYESYVKGLDYQLVYTSNELSGILQTVDEIQMQVGNEHYYWRKPDGDVYQYHKYEQPSNMTREDYELSMTNDGWEKTEWSDSLSTFDITEDSITSAVKKSSLSWVKYDSNNNITDIKAYDYWIAEYEQASSSVDYDNWVAQNKQYQKKEVKDSWSAIKQTADSVTSMVSDIDGNTSMINQLKDRIALAVEGDSKYWVVNETYTPTGYDDEIEAGNHAYKEWWSKYLATLQDQTTANSEDYETWVLETLSQNDNISIATGGYSLGAIDLTNNNILIGLSGHNGDYYGAITLQKEPGTNNAKIVLDANTTRVNGDFLVGALNGATTKISGNTIETGSITADKIAAGAINTNKVLTAGNGLNVLIKNGKVAFYYGAVDENKPNQNKRIEIGVEGGNNNDLVLKFFDENGGELYNLGPAGFIDMNGQFIYEFDHNLD